MSNSQPKVPETDYEKTLKILSYMKVHEPIALSAISLSSGIKLGEIIRLNAQLSVEKIIDRVIENGNILYILVEENYQPRIAELFAQNEEGGSKPAAIDSREAIKRRRSQRNANAAAPPAAPVNETVRASDIRRNEAARSAANLLMNRRSSTTNHVYDTGLRSSSQHLSRVARTAQPSSHSDSPLHRTVYRGSRSFSGERSTFTAMPPAGFAPNGLERSDTNFKQRTDYNPNPLQSIIPSSAIASVNNEVPLKEVYEILGIDDNTPFLTVLSPRPTFDVWSSCSALVNAGGGVLILGMRKYGRGSDRTFFIKSVNNPEDAVRTLYKSFKDREIISDCPKDATFIEITEFGRKKVIVMRLSPALFSPAPLYLARDSFGMRTKEGCYIYKNEEAVRCTEDEIKEMWQKIRLGEEKPDWKQSGEMLPVTMERIVKIKLPEHVDDAVRPLSRGTDALAETSIPSYIPRQHKTHAQPKEIAHTDPPPLPTPQPLSRSVESAEKKNAQKEFSKLANEGGYSQTPQDSAPKRRTPTPKEAERDMLQLVLFAEDIRANNASRFTADLETVSSRANQASSRANQANLTAETTIKPAHFSESSQEIQAQPPRSEDAKPASQPSAPAASAEKSRTGRTVLPPAFDEIDRSILDAIAEPAVEHARLPGTRLAEIASALLVTARLTPEELCELLRRKLPVVRSKIINVLKDNPDFKKLGKAYYINKGE